MDLIGRLNQGAALLRQRRPIDALRILAPICGPQDDDPHVVAARSYAYALLGDVATALHMARKIATQEGLDEFSLDFVANSLTLCHRPQEAYPLYRRVTDLSPQNASHLFNLAATARFLGRTQEAEVAYDRAIACDPGLWAAYRNRSELRVQTGAHNHRDELIRLLEESSLDWRAQVELNFALGKELEDLKDFERAFEAIKRGNDLRRTHMQYNVQPDLDTMSIIEDVFDTAYFERVAPSTVNAEPIFILGLPRSGSSLLEHLISAHHAQVQPLGELQSLTAAIMAELRTTRKRSNPDKNEAVRRSASLNMGHIADRYLETIRPLRDTRPFFIDKLPLNFLYIGLIAKALPSARIICMERDPLDLCWAIYKTLFAEAYPFSYDLAELAAYCAGYARLMKHWQNVLGNRLIAVRYEELAADHEGKITTLLETLDLPPQKTNGAKPTDEAIMTASASQVRHPVHTRSVRNADQYPRQLAGLRQALGIEQMHYHR